MEKMISLYKIGTNIGLAHKLPSPSLRVSARENLPKSVAANFGISFRYTFSFNLFT